MVWICSTLPRAIALAPGRALTQYQRRTWGSEQGLPGNNVISVTQGSDGYLWLGTEEGLVRFDGLRTRVFDRQSDPILLGNSVYSVTEVPHHPGQFTLGTSAGVCRFTGGRISAFPSDEAPAGLPGRVILRDPSDGGLWVRTVRGLFRVGPDGQPSGPMEGRPGWPGEKIRTLTRDAAGRLWLGTLTGLYRQQDDPTDEPRFALLPDWAGETVDHLAPARAGGLWVGSRDAGTGHLAGDGSFHPRGKLRGCVVDTLLEDRSGMVWVGTHGSGLFRFPADDAADPELATTSLNVENGMVHNLVSSLCEDREGSLWIGTQGGLLVLRDVRFVNVGRPEGLTGDDVRTVFEDPRGRLWIGHENGLGLLNSRGDGVTNHALPLSARRPGDNRVLCVGPGEDGETLWVGTNAGLVSWREGRMTDLPLRPDLDRLAVRALCVDVNGDHWVGTESGVYQVRAGQVLSRLGTAEGMANDGVRGLHLDRRGTLWVATGGGLTCREPDGRITNFLNTTAHRTDSTVLAFYEEPTARGDLFVGTEFGLHRLRATAGGKNQITRYTVRDGLFDDLMWSVIGDGRGNLWMSSNKGICRVAIADLDRFDRGEITVIPHVAYGLADGLRSREGNGGHQPTACRDRLGRLWFATVKGAVMVDPAHVEPNALAPPVQVEELFADGRVVPVTRAAAVTSGASSPPRVLPAGTQKLDFHFTALSFLAPEANRFRYWLEGFDLAWTDAKTERTAHYTNLPPGNYRFCVQAANADGIWNPSSATLAFRLEPFFYQTGWFRTLVVGAAVGALWGGVLALRRRWHGRLVRAETEVRERTRAQETLRGAMDEAERERHVAELARQEAETAREEAERANVAKGEFLSRLSHELRTPLNAILGFGQILEMDELPGAQGQSVEHILGGGRRLLELVDEILDLTGVGNGEAPVQAEEVSLDSLLGEVVSLIEPLARQRGVSLRCDRDGAAGVAGHVRGDGKRLKQVLLNLLSNAVQFNRAVGGEVFIGVHDVPSARQTESRKRIFVRDTGPGIDTAGLAKLFTPFERLGAAYGPIKGTGLGLTISKKLVEAMGGTLGVESALGVGSTFWVELPSVPTPTASASPQTVSGPTSDPATVRTATHTGPSSLLYIEDNESNRKLVENILRQHRPDLLLRCVPDGLAGLVAARTEPGLSLILLDLQLPDLTGEEVLRRLRADSATGEIPVVVISADATTSTRSRLQTAGAAEYLTKPLELPRLLTLLAGCLPPPSPAVASGS